MNIAIDNFYFVVKDIEKSIEFYTNLIGMKPTSIIENRWAEWKATDKEIYFGIINENATGDKVITGNNGVLGLYTQNVKEAYECCKKINAKILYEPEVLENSVDNYVCFAIEDLDGNKIEIASYDKIKNIQKINYTIEKVKVEDKDVLNRLLQYSLFEESQTDLNEMNDEAIFEYKWLDSYFEKDNREAFFVREEETNKLLGFVMVNQYMQKSQSGHSIAEFMIIPKYRRMKIGKRVANDIFNMYNGIWEVSPSYGSDKAYKFWENVIGEFTKNDYTYEDRIFIFKNK